MWVRFLADFDWHPPEKKGRVHIAYKAGMTLLVRRICGEQAIAAGKAVATERTPHHGHHQH